MKNIDSKYTPGPWHIQGLGTLLHPVSKRQLTTTRIATKLGTFEIYDETNEPGYNEILIARAPELLEACERVLSKWNPETGRQLERLLGTETVNVLNRVVKNAKGQI